MGPAPPALLEVDSASAAERVRDDYFDRELGELAEPLAGLAAQARETHLLMNNCYRDNAVRNAARPRELLGARRR